MALLKRRRVPVSSSLACEITETQAKKMLDRYRGFSVRLMLLVLAAGTSFSLEASAQSKRLISVLTPPSQISVERTVDGNSFVQDMSDAAGQLKSYSFKYETTV